MGHGLDGDLPAYFIILCRQQDFGVMERDNLVATLVPFI